MKYKICLLFLVAYMMSSGLMVQAGEVTGAVSTGVQTNISGTVVVVPSASPTAGVYTVPQSVVLTALGSDSVRYTTDGATPSCTSSSAYSSSLTINASTTVKAVACYPNNIASPPATFSYAINIQMKPLELPALLITGVFLVPVNGVTTSTPSLNVTQKVTVDVGILGNGTSSVVIPGNTTITSALEDNFDATALTATSVPSGALAGLAAGTVLDGALQWGVSNVTLAFNPAITINVFVGAALNGQTLDVVRSITGSGNWTNDGIVTPAICLVTNGLCSFSATKASYYAVLTPAPTAPAPAPSGGGGGGGGGGSGGGVVGEVLGVSTGTPAVTIAAIPLAPAVETAPKKVSEKSKTTGLAPALSSNQNPPSTSSSLPERPAPKLETEQKPLQEASILLSIQKLFGPGLGRLLPAIIILSIAVLYLVYRKLKKNRS